MLDNSRLKRMDDVNCETVLPQTGSLSFSLSGWQQKYCLISAIINMTYIYYCQKFLKAF